MKVPIMATATAAAMLLALALPAMGDRLVGLGFAGMGGRPGGGKGAGRLNGGGKQSAPAFPLQGAGRARHAGYDIDLVRAVAKRLGVAVETVSLSSAERIPMLKNGQV